MAVSSTLLLRAFIGMHCPALYDAFCSCNFDDELCLLPLLHLILSMYASLCASFLFLYLTLFFFLPYYGE